MAQGKCRDIPWSSRPELLRKTEVFCNTAKLIYWKSTGKHADLPYHLRKHLAHEIPLRTAIPIPPSSGKLTVATGKSHLLKNSLCLAACGQRANCVVLHMGAANLSIPKGAGFCWDRGHSFRKINEMGYKLLMSGNKAWLPPVGMKQVHHSLPATLHRNSSSASLGCKICNTQGQMPALGKGLSWISLDLKTQHEQTG